MLGFSSLGPYFFGVTRLTGLRLRVLDIYIYYSNVSTSLGMLDRNCSPSLRYVNLYRTVLHSRARYRSRGTRRHVSSIGGRSGNHGSSGELRKSAST